MLILLLCTATKPWAQEFVNLTAEEVRIDSVLPVVSYQFPLEASEAALPHSVAIEYPDFIDMSDADIERYHAITSDTLPQLPEVHISIGTSRRQATLSASFVPLVFREGKYQKLVGFKLAVKNEGAKDGAPTSARVLSPLTSQRYATHSVLATGQWAKISVTQTGVYQLTEALIRQAGFSDLSKVKIYGYGGALQPEVLTADYLTATDDLKEVPSCTIGGRRLFHAIGPVSWSDATTTLRTRNPYSDTGCYFITQTNYGEPLSQDSATFVAAFYPAADDYHSLHEVDDYAWYHSGRNLFESTPIATSGYSTYQLAAHTDSGRLTIAVSYDAVGTVSVEVNDSAVGSINIGNALSKNMKANSYTTTFSLNGLLQANNTIRLRQTAGSGTMRLDYMALTMPTPAPAPNLTTDDFSAPKLEYRITNQDHHADPAADLVIIIPTTQKLLSQAQRLKQLHEERDSLRVNIVPADELYNEFSSGTPDANAYRRYLKMLYDRAETEANMPRYLLLFGDGAWDNRMNSTNWRQFSPDDFLLCYESENSFSETDSYVSDDYFCLLDDGEGAALTDDDRTDVGVGRLSARTEAEATILVDKITDYACNAHAGDWQNTACFMGDDGNDNVHMSEAEAAAVTAATERSAFSIKKVYWDAYERTTSSTGFGYPDVRSLILQQMQSGALIMDYCGHGAPYQISHEKVLLIDDFATQTSLRLPLWVTASCDIMPFDSQEENIGETAMANARGGAIAFFGTTRTVYTGDNRYMNCAFLKYAVRTQADGRRYTLGDAVRLAKNEVRGIKTSFPNNKLHYSLLGDPALALAVPTGHITIDSINGLRVGTDSIKLAAGQRITVSGHVDDAPQFDGIVTLTVKDVEQTVVCRLNNTADREGSSTPYIFHDRPSTVYNGTDSLRAGHFTISFALPLDISYSDASGQMTAYALSSDKQSEAHGICEAFTMGDGGEVTDNGVGPSIYCYLNNTSFANGGNVNTTPFFFAQITDKDGINAAGSSLGHDLELVIDGDQSMTYNLNEHFQYDFGDYCSGTVGFSLPELAEGQHQLSFRAWDVLNNSSVALLNFNVVRGLQPNCFSVECTKNPATTGTTFIINHDRTGSQMDISLEVFDASGRLLWQKTETGVSTDNTYQLDWDLCTSNGSRLQTGVYLYRVGISSDGSKRSSQAQKLIILRK